MYKFKLHLRDLPLKNCTLLLLIKTGKVLILLIILDHVPAT